jgi:hypothetical protein
MDNRARAALGCLLRLDSIAGYHQPVAARPAEERGLGANVTNLWRNKFVLSKRDFFTHKVKLMHAALMHSDIFKLLSLFLLRSPTRSHLTYVPLFRRYSPRSGV